MRLIDADVLKDCIIPSRCNGKSLLMSLIDSTPTIDAVPLSALRKAAKKLAYIHQQIDLYGDRPDLHEEEYWLEYLMDEEWKDAELSYTKWDWAYTRPNKDDKPDMVNHPPHYQSESGLEVIDIIDDFVPDPGSYYLGNIIKYILRFQKKGGVEDLEKARWYLNKLIARESVKED